MVAALSQTSGLPLKAARDYVCDGCYEPMIAGQCEFAFSNIVTLDALECALNEGARFNQAGPVYLRGWKLSFRSQPAAEIHTFEQLQDLYLRHLRYLTVQFYTGVLNNYGALYSYCPSPLLSVVVDGCVETGRDLSNGGARYHLIAPMYLAMATTIDSLYAIKKLVFDQETAVTTLTELVDALQEDWGYGMEEPFQSQLAGRLRSDERAKRFQQLRLRALELPKFGMGHPEVDALGGWLTQSISTLARRDAGVSAAGARHHPRAPEAGVLGEGSALARSTCRWAWAPSRPTWERARAAAPRRAAAATASPYPSDFSPTPVPQDLPPIAQDPQAEERGGGHQPPHLHGHEELEPGLHQPGVLERGPRGPEHPRELPAGGSGGVHPPVRPGQRGLEPHHPHVRGPGHLPGRGEPAGALRAGARAHRRVDRVLRRDVPRPPRPAPAQAVVRPRAAAQGAHSRSPREALRP